MRTINLSTGETEKLNYERYRCPDPLVSKRLHAVYMKAASGWSDKEIGRAVDACRNSVARWLDMYESGGFDALCRVGYGANRSEMDGYSVSIADSFCAEPPVSIAPTPLACRPAGDGPAQPGPSASRKPFPASNG